MKNEKEINVLLCTINVMLRLDNFRWSEFFLCRNTAMGAAVFSPFNSVNIVRCGSKTCSSRRTILIHHLYMKLVEPPTMFWEILSFFNFILGTITRISETAKYKHTKRPG